MSAETFAYRGPQELLPTIEQALRRVVDPELAMNIVDVGLVVDVSLTGRQLRVQVTMTSAACPVAEVILEDVEQQLARALPAGLHSEVELVWEPPWTPERLSAHARRFMGW